MPVPTPSDAELDALIKARLALAGIDLNQLPATATAATAATVAGSLRLTPEQAASLTE